MALLCVLQLSTQGLDTSVQLAFRLLMLGNDVFMLGSSIILLLTKAGFKLCNTCI